jgi:hypothetical protein
MAWWGLARSTSDKRAEEFIKEAVKRKNTVTERERLYIEASEKAIVNDPLRDRGDSYRNQNDEYRKTLETIAVKFPSDMEARALIALTSIGDTRYATEQIIREVLAKEPDHPGAHHYRIHNWNYHEPEQSLESCRRYGLIAPGAGHALHMPGPRLRDGGDVERSRHQHGLRHARRETVHARPDDLSVQRVELRAQPKLPELHLRAACHAGSRDFRRAADDGCSARSEIERRKRIFDALAGDRVDAAHVGEVRAVEGTARFGDDQVARSVRRQGESELR